MIKSRKRQREFSDEDDDDGGAPAELGEKDEESEDEMGGTGWGDDDDDDDAGSDEDKPEGKEAKATRFGDDDGEIKTKDGKITSVEGEEEANFGEEEDYEEGGIKIVPFNLKAEMSEGTFTEDGMYVDNKFAETRDMWLEEVDTAAKERKKRGEKMQKVEKVEIADFDQEDDNLDILELKKSMLECLLPGEKVQKALKRLRGAKKDGGLDYFNKLMEAANNLLQVGEFNIYNETQTSIEESVAEAERADAEGQWDLKWQMTDDEVHGPFSTAQMAAWAAEGYFKQRPGLVRKRDPRKATESIPFVGTHTLNFESEKDKSDMLNDLLDSDDEPEGTVQDAE